MRKLLTALLLLPGSAVMADPPSPANTIVDTPTAGATACDSDGDGFCRLTWNVPSGSYGSFWVEEMDPETSFWRRLPKPLPARSGTTPERVQDGRLYRVVACQDASGSGPCTSSTVQWAPFKPMSADSIPELVDNKRGGKMLVSKKSHIKSQAQQYNVYLVERLLNGIEDMRSMPPMTPPRFGHDVSNETLVKLATEWEIIDNTVHGIYEARRGMTREPDEVPP